MILEFNGEVYNTKNIIKVGKIMIDSDLFEDVDVWGKIKVYFKINDNINVMLTKCVDNPGGFETKGEYKKLHIIMNSIELELKNELERFRDILINAVKGEE